MAWIAASLDWSAEITDGRTLRIVGVGPLAQATSPRQAHAMSAERSFDMFAMVDAARPRGTDPGTQARHGFTEAWQMARRESAM